MPHHPVFESSKDLESFILTCSTERFQEILPALSLTELTSCFVLLQTQVSLEKKEKLENLFEFADISTLKHLAHDFSPASFITFIEFLIKHDEHENRLTFLLRDLPPSTFSQALVLIQDRHLDVLRKGGLLESLQYQLAQFEHEGEDLIIATGQNLQQFQQELSSIQTNELTGNILQNIEYQIDEIRTPLLIYLESMDKALAIAWHTDRRDLIEKLSAIHKTMQHQILHAIGHPVFDEEMATGIYAWCEETFSNIFNSSLEDDDAAIEGITRLNLWELKDYWEIGLLPSIQRLEELNLDPKTHNEKECRGHQEKLLLHVQENLKRLGIGKVANLKKQHLFSKALLQTYIAKNQHLLISR